MATLQSQTEKKRIRKKLLKQITKNEFTSFPNEKLFPESNFNRIYQRRFLTMKKGRVRIYKNFQYRFLKKACSPKNSKSTSGGGFRRGKNSRFPITIADSGSEKRRRKKRKRMKER